MARHARRRPAGGHGIGSGWAPDSCPPADCCVDDCRCGGDRARAAGPRTFDNKRGLWRAVVIAIGVREPGGPEVLVPIERPMPTIGAGEVLIKVAAAGVNRPDVMQR